MERISRYGRRMRLTLINMTSFACLVCILTFPFLSDTILKHETGYYTVYIDDEEIGCANSREEAAMALASARQELSKQYEDCIYMNPNIRIEKKDKAIAERMEVTELSSAIYSCLFDNVMDIDMQMVYLLRIGDYTVTMETKDDIVKLFEKIIAKYDKDKAFQVTVEVADAASGTYGLKIAEKKLDSTSAEIVASKIEGTVVVDDNGASGIGDGLVSISFGEEIVISETSATNAKTTSVDKAYEDITKEHAEKTFYTVEPGDTLSGIASNHGLSLNELFALNSGISESSIIVPGDSLVITVPASQINVITKRQMTYEEDFNADTIYIEDDTAYRGTNYVIEEGTTGHRSVIAEVTYSNASETDRKYLQQIIMKESKAATVSVGTLTPPTYVKPLYGGTFSSGFGYRADGNHLAVDWSCPTGTTIFASSGGTVTRAGWFSAYGYCVDITHPDGTMTRYAHNSQVLVSVGQHVEQYDTIALSGSTGDSSGPHCHFEIWVGGTRVNPLNYVNKY